MTMAENCIASNKSGMQSLVFMITQLNENNTLNQEFVLGFLNKVLEQKPCTSNDIQDILTSFISSKLLNKKSFVAFGAFVYRHLCEVRIMLFIELGQYDFDFLQIEKLKKDLSNYKSFLIDNGSNGSLNSTFSLDYHNNRHDLSYTEPKYFSDIMLEIKTKIDSINKCDLSEEREKEAYYKIARNSTIICFHLVSKSVY